MVLTEEQKERIRKNRQRALEIRRTKLKQKEVKETNPPSTDSSINHVKGEIKRHTGKVISPEENAVNDEVKVETEEELEEFEMGASPYVTKTEAMKKYCLPAGTLAVCAYIEKDNPRQSKWNKMILYHRSEIRRRARRRFGGLDGALECD